MSQYQGNLLVLIFLSWFLQITWDLDCNSLLLLPLKFVFGVFSYFETFASFLNPTRNSSSYCYWFIEYPRSNLIIIFLPIFKVIFVYHRWHIVRLIVFWFTIHTFWSLYLRFPTSETKQKSLMAGTIHEYVPPNNSSNKPAIFEYWDLSFHFLQLPQVPSWILWSCSGFDTRDSTNSFTCLWNLYELGQLFWSLAWILSQPLNIRALIL